MRKVVDGVPDEVAVATNIAASQNSTEYFPPPCGSDR